MNSNPKRIDELLAQTKLAVPGRAHAEQTLAALRNAHTRHIATDNPYWAPAALAAMAALALLAVLYFTFSPHQESGNTPARRDTSPVSDEDPTTKTSSYEFILNGEAFLPDELYKCGDSWATGDIVFVHTPDAFGELGFTLGDPGRYELETEVGGDNYLRMVYLKTNGKRIPLAVRIGEAQGPDGKPAIDCPLDDLTAQQIRCLRGIYVDAGKACASAQEILGKNSDIQWQHMFLDITSYNDRYPLTSLEGLYGLELTGKFDFTAFEKADSLAVLCFNGFYSKQDTAAALELSAGQAGLRYLALRGADFSGVTDYSAPTALRVVELSYCKSLRTLDCLSKCTALHTARARHCAVLENVDALAALSTLQSVDCMGNAKLAELPASVQSEWRELNVLGTALTAQQVDAFRNDHPQCVVAFEWTDALRQCLADVEKIVVRSTFKESSLAPAVETGPDSIKQLIDAIEVVGSNKRCRCIGDFFIEFHTRTRGLVVITTHHGESLRWDGWPSDADLTQESASAIETWLNEHGHRSK